MTDPDSAEPTPETAAAATAADGPTEPRARRITRRGLLTAAGGAAAGVAVGWGGTYAYAKEYPWVICNEIDQVSKGIPPNRADYGSMRVLWNVRTDEKAIALTYDDGPHGAYTERFLDVLAEHDARATFNVVGILVEGDAEIVRRAHAEGHEIGNHSWRHDHFVQRDQETITRSLERCADAVDAVIGERPRWFRPPRGEITGSVLLAAARTGHEILMWSYSGTKQESSPEVFARDFERSLAPGMIVSYHDGLGSTTFGRESASKKKFRRYREAELAALPRVIAVARDAGYRFVTTSELAALERSTS